MEHMMQWYNMYIEKGHVIGKPDRTQPILHPKKVISLVVYPTVSEVENCEL